MIRARSLAHMFLKSITINKSWQLGIILGISISPLITTVSHASEQSFNSRHSIVSSTASANLEVLPDAINLVKYYEGFRANAYIDTSGGAVIGYGLSKVDGKRVSLGQYITQAQADVALERELQRIQQMVLASVKVDLNPNQLGALTSLVYNAGTRILTNSTLIRKLNAGDYAGAAREFPRWNKAHQGGRLVAFPGLTKRRLAEQQLFVTPYQQIASNK